MEFIKYTNNNVELNMPIYDYLSIGTIFDVYFFNYYSLVTKSIINTFKTIKKKRKTHKITKAIKCKAHNQIYIDDTR